MPELLSTASSFAHEESYIYQDVLRVEVCFHLYYQVQSSKYGRTYLPSSVVCNVCGVSNVQCLAARARAPKLQAQPHGQDARTIRTLPSLWSTDGIYASYQRTHVASRSMNNERVRHMYATVGIANSSAIDLNSLGSCLQAFPSVRCLHLRECCRLCQCRFWRR